MPGTVALATMPTADATLLPPPFSSSRADSGDDGPHSVRSLHEVGVETVLGAMIEHRRASQPSFASIVVPCDASEEADEAEDTQRAPTTSEVFLKAR
jgi:hypothetical protein